MFIVTDKREVDWPVEIPVPADGGNVRKYPVTVRFEIISDAEREACYANGGDDSNLVRRVVVGWKESDFTDAQKQPLPFSPENLDRVVQIPYARFAIAVAYIQASSGREAARKN